MMAKGYAARSLSNAKIGTIGAGEAEPGPGSFGGPLMMVRRLTIASLPHTPHRPLREFDTVSQFSQ